MGSMKAEKLRFCIDRGGIFTDIYAEVPGGSGCCAMKLLSVDPSSYDDAPIDLSNAEEAAREMLKAVAVRVEHECGSTVVEEEDYMDDGSVIHLKLSIDSMKGEASFDFEGTSSEVYGNWNAPEAVTAAAVIYCLRCLVDVDIPLNQGCLARVKIHIPQGCGEHTFGEESACAERIEGGREGWRQLPDSQGQEKGVSWRKEHRRGR